MPNVTYLRGSILHFLRDPGEDADPAPGNIGMTAPEDRRRQGGGGRAAPAKSCQRAHRAGMWTTISGKLILPGFVDTHVHLPRWT